MPVVPPMVSAANGALLIPHVASAQGRLTLLLGCYAMFGISASASVIIITQIWARLGTCVTGTIALAARSGADVLRAASVALFALLVAAWLLVAARTVAGSATGRLFKCDLAGRGGEPGGWWPQSPGPCLRRRGSRGRPGNRGSRGCPGCA